MSYLYRVELEKGVRYDRRVVYVRAQCGTTAADKALKDTLNLRPFDKSGGRWRVTTVEQTESEKVL